MLYQNSLYATCIGFIHFKFKLFWTIDLNPIIVGADLLVNGCVYHKVNHCRCMCNCKCSTV